jgi:polygalacturonase
MLIRFENCSQISVADVSLKRCGSWCMHLKNSRDIFLRNIRINNEKQDGFDLESCQDVSISDCHLECGDDAIAITTSSREHPARNDCFFMDIRRV